MSRHSQVLISALAMLMLVGCTEQKSAEFGPCKTAADCQPGLNCGQNNAIGATDGLCVKRAAGSSTDTTGDTSAFDTAVADLCTNGVLDPIESATDCGGPCKACQPGQTCKTASDCATSRCEDGVCRSCGDGQATGTETDVDCGGPCSKCGAGKLCKAEADCSSGWCDVGTCKCVPKCSCQDSGFKVAYACGDDGCGGTCGTCGSGEACFGGHCVHPACANKCSAALGSCGVLKCAIGCSFGGVDNGAGGQVNCECFNKGSK